MIADGMPFQNQLPFFLIVGGLFSLVSCSSNDEPTPFDCNESDLSFQVSQVTGASGCDIADGSIAVVAAGGKAPYEFSLNNLPKQTSGLFVNLSAGIYTVKVSDANKCETEVNNINVTATGFSVTVDVAPDNLCLEGNGSVTVMVEDGETPYQYQIGGGVFSGDNVFTGLQKGSHLITVKDNSNCTVQLNVTVPHGKTGTSWTSEILPIIETKCATSGCHDGNFRPDLRAYDKAFFYRDLIKKYTQDKSMPFDGPPLPPDQINLIGCWVDDGAPQN